MSQNEFFFKQFKIIQDKDVMKVGTDGVLLGAWTDPSDADFILDVGTGTGLLALMMAQKSSAHIDAIDINADAHEQSRINFEHSPWKERLRSFHRSFQQFANEDDIKYDLIISNPPFYLDAHRADTESRNIARHLDESITIPDLVDNVKKLLSVNGKFCVVFPFKEGVKLMEHAETNGLYLCKVTRVKTKVGKQEKRLMMVFTLTRKTLIDDEIIIHDQEMNYSEQYKDLTSDFYLNN